MIILTGDFNLHIDNPSDPATKEFLNILHCLDFIQHVTQPSHNRGHTLDLVITHGLSTSVSSVVDLAVSDHYCVFFNITGFIQRETSVRTMRRRYLTSEVAANFTRVLDECPPVILPAPCDLIFSYFNSKLKKSLDSVAPLTTKKINVKHASPWRNEEVKKLKRNCRAAERRWRKNKNNINHQIFCEQLKVYNNTLRKSRNSYFAKIISINKNNPKVLFSTIDHLFNPDFNSSQRTPTDSLCEQFADHFRGKISAIRSDILSNRDMIVNTSEGSIVPEETLDSFVLVNAENLQKVFSTVRPTTCLLDPIPSSLFKTLYGFFEAELLCMMNCSLQLGVFPAAFKTAVVRPLLKKSNLDCNDFNNYRPVSNLPFLSKVLEKLVFTQITDFLNDRQILEIFQSGFRVNHSTETALLKVLNDLRCNWDSQKLSVLVLLDLSAAFDTVDHAILLNRLKHMVGLSGAVHNWFTSCLSDRSFMVSMDTCFSKIHKMTCGVPQGSVLGPVLFNLYMLPLGSVIRRHGVNFHSYADDTQLYISVSPDDTRQMDALFNCILDIRSWMAENFLQLNQDKTEVLIVGPEAQREKLLSKLEAFSLCPSLQVKNLGVIFDSELGFIPHVKHVTKIGFYHLKNIARVRPILSRANTEMLMHAFITSRIDYCNALLSGLPKKNISPLQLLQNSAARVLTKTRGRAHITPVLESLHWLPVCFRIDFKVLLLVFKCLNGLGPSYLSDLLLPYEPSRTLRSSGTGLLIVPKVRTHTHGEAAFQWYGPRLWNSLPEELRAAENVHVFKNRLKTHLFNLAFT
uniref:Reverse transcriptase domain-containing protein n=1 Tax=Astatotilapia calliptera TaxID=8154 RepID=A0A3P8P5K8_ASTCA